MYKKYVWTNEEIDFLKQNYDKVQYKDLAAKLGKTRDGISWMRAKLGLKSKRIKGNQSYCFRFKPELFFKFKAQVEANGLNISEVLERLIIEYLAVQPTFRISGATIL